MLGYLRGQIGWVKEAEYAIDLILSFDGQQFQQTTMTAMVKFKDHVTWDSDSEKKDSNSKFLAQTANWQYLASSEASDRSNWRSVYNFSEVQLKTLVHQIQQLHFQCACTGIDPAKIQSSEEWLNL